MIPKKGFDSRTDLLKCWESFHPETLNQKVCRLLLSVHKRCSRLAVLGELGRYPVFIPALKHCIKYQFHIDRMDRSSLISITLSDMKNNPQVDCWLSRVQRIKTLLDIKRVYGTPDRTGLIIEKQIKSKYDRFFLDQINLVRIGKDGEDHNKLRLYKHLKGSFTIEPYVVQIKNRNQRQWLSRYRTSAHTLRIETGRYTRPITPKVERKCLYCNSESIDNEKHFILFCGTFKLKRQCFFSRLNVLNPRFNDMTIDEKLNFILCPPNADVAKCVSKFLGIMTIIRKEIDMGLNPKDLNLYLKHVAN